MISLQFLDQINGIVEAACCIPTIADCWSLYKTASINETNIFSQVYYLICGVWWAFYFLMLGQHTTFIADQGRSRMTLTIPR